MAEAQPMGSGLCPYLTIGGGRAAEAIDFYRHAFGAEETSRMMHEDDRRVMHASLVINGGTLMLSDEFPEFPAAMTGTTGAAPAGVTVHMNVDDAAAWARRAVEAGAVVTVPFADQFWGDHFGQLRDPFGHSWSIGSPIRRTG